MAKADVEFKASRDRIVGLKEEVEQLRRHVHSLQQESADKEVKIVQMMKQHSLDKEDLQGLNIALDSKQQELQLVCFFLFKIIYFSYLILTFISWRGNMVLRGQPAVLLLSLTRRLIVASPRFSLLPLCRLDLRLWSLIREQIPLIFREGKLLSRCRHHLPKFWPLGKVRESTEVDLHQYHLPPTKPLCVLGRTVLLWDHLLWSPVLRSALLHPRRWALHSHEDHQLKVW